MSRKPLPEGHIIKMANGAEYRILHLISEGGFSLATRLRRKAEQQLL